MKVTKKALKEQQVAENKRAAWGKKVQVLIGHVLASSHFARVGHAEFDVAYTQGRTAEDFAAEIASREPVGRAVHPSKVQAVEFAANKAHETIKAVFEDLQKHGMDVNAAAPYPDSNKVSRFEYINRRDKHYLYAKLTREVDDGSYHYIRRNEPKIVEMSPSGATAFVLEAEKEAAFQYDAFICKLVAKVGPCKSATLSGNHIWASSLLTVVKEGNIVEYWSTHQIWNQSCLGKVFPQWPTRLLKGHHRSVKN